MIYTSHKLCNFIITFTFLKYFLDKRITQISTVHICCGVKLHKSTSDKILNIK